jgi:PAS domain S-box-containing protein
MKIKSQFIICIIVFSVILVIIAASVAFSEQEVVRISAQEQISSTIERGASDLNSEAINYFLYQDPIYVSRWQNELSYLSGNLSNIETYNSQQQILTNHVSNDLTDLNNSFSTIITYLQNVPRNVSVRIDPAFQMRWNGLTLQSYTLTTDAAQLSEALDNQAHMVNETNILLIVSLVATFGALLGTIYLIVFRRTLKSVTELQKGIDTIGSGNLEYVIEPKRQDEISELSQSFNKMTSNLKEVTASKTDLEQAQASLRASEQRWVTTLESIGDAVIATDMTGKISFINGVAECLTGWTLAEASLKPVKEIFNIVNEQTRLEVEDPVNKVLENGMIVGLANHTILIRKDGTEVPIDDSGAPIKDKDGKTTGVVLIFRDITERKSAEKALRESEVKFRTVADFTYDWEFWMAPDGNLVYVSPSCKSVTGYEADEFIHSPKLLTKIVHPEDKSIVGSHFDLVSSEENHEFDFRIVTRTGETRWISHACRAVFDDHGKWIGRRSSNRDITGRKKAEAALQESEERFSKAFHNSPVPQIITRFGDWRYVDANESALRLLEFSREELLGHTSAELNLIQLDKPDQGVRLVNERGELRDFETSVRTKSGKIIIVLTSTETVTLNGQKHLINTFIDITLRKQMQAKLEEYAKNLEELVVERTKKLEISEEKYRTLFDTIDEGFCIIEMVFDAYGKPLDYRFLDLNSAFERQTGLVNAKGKLMRSLVPNHEEYWFETYGRIAMTGEPTRFTNEAKSLNRWYDVYAFPVGEGKIRKVGILFNDITQRKNLEKQLKDSERLAAIGATAGMVGHDIRNPLQAITGDVYLAKTELAEIPESPEKQNTIESLQEIEKNIEYINKIVADLQDFARPLKPHFEEADLKLIIDQLLAKNGLPKNIKVKVKVENSALKVLADSAYLNRILYNLVTNAVQAMPNGGKLTILAFKDKKTDEAVISVGDTGVGIPESVKGKLFTPMFTTKSKGQGFGLAVIKRMTEALNGTVTFDSEEGNGTKFTVRFPQISKKKTDF